MKVQHCEHCGATLRRPSMDARVAQGKGRHVGKVFCDELCAQRYEEIGVLMTCPCPCGRTFGSREGFGLFLSAECAIAYATTARALEVEAWTARSA